MPTRRIFLKNTALTTTGMLMLKSAFSSAFAERSSGAMMTKKPRHILLRSGWQVENIGDIGHTPAMMALMEKYIPDAVVTFWPWYSFLPDNEAAMLKKRFPQLQMVKGVLDANGEASTKELKEAIENTDFLLHNSGPATIAWQDLVHIKKMGKPFGVYGVSYGLYGTPEKDILSDAAFVYFRDSVSLQKATEAGIHPPVMGFSPDAVFGIDITDDDKGIAFLEKNNLEDGKFLCCIPKQRFTPVWLHVHKNRPVDEVKNARNEEMKEHDHLPLRDAITAIITTTNHKILICHEDETEMPIGKEWLLDKLPEEVRSKVVWRNAAWMTDEAISIYKRSAGLFGAEMHSPIMCIANGIPAIVVRWEEQSSKGIMWKNIGLGEWLFDFDIEADIGRFVPTVLAMASDTVAAKTKAVRAKEVVTKMMKDSLKIIEKKSRPLNF